MVMCAVCAPVWSRQEVRVQENEREGGEVKLSVRRLGAWSDQPGAVAFGSGGGRDDDGSPAGAGEAEGDTTTTTDARRLRSDTSHPPQLGKQLPSPIRARERQ